MKKFNVLWDKPKAVIVFESMEQTISIGLFMFRENRSSGRDLIASGLSLREAQEFAKVQQYVLDARKENSQSRDQMEVEDMRVITEMAAKAAGMQVEGWSVDHSKGMRLVGLDHEFVGFWNPRFDDKDSTELAIKLKLQTGFDDRFKDLGYCAYCTYPTGENSCDSIMQNVEQAGGRDAARRATILMAAAEMQAIRQEKFATFA